jgi:uncharacterized protein YegL
MALYNPASLDVFMACPDDPSAGEPFGDWVFGMFRCVDSMTLILDTMRTRYIAAVVGLLCLSACVLQAKNTETNIPAASVVIVYDASGSMKDKVSGEDGNRTPKFEVANKALASIADKLDEFTRTKQTNIEVGLVLFVDSKVRAEIPLHTLDAAQIKTWAQNFKRPNGGTPLGDGIRKASEMLAKSASPKKHILVITDGESNVGTSPEQVIRRMQKTNQNIPVYFVAFDVDARVFEPVKKLGATVVSASNEAQLRTQIDSIVGKKILLEAE